MTVHIRFDREPWKSMLREALQRLIDSGELRLPPPRYVEPPRYG